MERWSLEEEGEKKSVAQIFAAVTSVVPLLLTRCWLSEDKASHSFNLWSHVMKQAGRRAFLSKGILLYIRQIDQRENSKSCNFNGWILWFRVDGRPRGR